MKYAVVIPVLAEDVFATKGYFQPVDYFLRHGVTVALVLNGCDAYVAHACLAFYEMAPTNFLLLCGGEDQNPYPARNVGLSKMFGDDPDLDAVVLVDSDTEIHEDYHTNALACIARDRLIAGRVNTRVPTGVSRHLDWLAEVGFECFDGFTPPGATIGANMIIGRAVWDAVGPMKADRVSGGDADYSTRATALGFKCSYCHNILVTKVISKYSYQTIISKQIRRSTCANRALHPKPDIILAGLRGSLHKHLHALEGAKSLTDLRPKYGDLIDSLFALMWFEGLLATAIDEEVQ